MSKPNGEEIGVFKISIDDGYVEYTYRLRPRTKTDSINSVYERIRKAFFVKRVLGEIRRKPTRSVTNE